MDLSAYSQTTPDTIYTHGGTASKTFFYIPRTKELIERNFPTNHLDMLHDPDDSDVFDAVYPKLLDKIDADLRARGLRGTALDDTLDKTLAPYQSRGEASKHAVLGRFGILHGDPVIAVWRSVDDPEAKEAVQAIINKHGLDRLGGELIVVGANGKTEKPEGKPVLASQLLGLRTAQRVIPDLLKSNVPEDYELKKYKVGNGVFSLRDIAALRRTTHTRRNFDPSLPGDPFSVLCHKDMMKYPELQAYIPNCPGIQRYQLRPTHPAVWRQKGRDLGINVYDYGEYVKQRDGKIL